MRPIGVRDLAALSAALADTFAHDGNHFTGLGNPQVTAFAWLAWREREAHDGRCTSFAGFNAAGELLGEVALSDLAVGSVHASLSYWVRRGARRRGIGLAMSRTICAYGFRELGLCRIDIAIARSNLPSKQLALALGATATVPAEDACPGDEIFHLYSSRSAAL